MIGVAAMSLPAWVSGLPVVVPSLGATVVAAAVAPDAAENAPLTIVAGHAIAVASALAALALCGLMGQPSALVVGVSAARMLALPLALGLTLLGMLLARRVHTPAGATALLVALGILRPGSDVVVLVVSVVYVAAVIAAFPRIAERLSAGARVTPRKRARASAR